ncbi:MAG: hypothetical protein MJD61_14875 [Proteobacteria bacterium]|nr:hypothetical protein [Pseudomonadota bacterium]
MRETIEHEAGNPTADLVQVVDERLRLAGCILDYLEHTGYQAPLKR